MLRILLLTASVLLLCGSMIPSQISAITYPRHNQVMQQKNGLASIKVEWRGAGEKIRLSRAGQFIGESTTGEFTDVTAGWYEAGLLSGGTEVDRINIGVGDVYVVAGQSNAVSPLQPDTYVPPMPPAGKVILSDYYRQGWKSFIDAGVTKPTAGIAWLHAGIALNRPYPVMFVIVARGNTSTEDWVYGRYGTLLNLETAWAMYQPKAILWHQGESDAGLNVPQATSFGNMDAIILSIRNVTTTPWVIAKNSTSSKPPAPYTSWPIRSAQQDIIDKWPHVHLGPDTDQIRVPGEVEYMGDGMRLHGQLWAKRLIELGL